MRTITAKLQEAKIGSWGAFLGVYALAVFVPFFIHLQWLTGPLVNALLIICLFLAGIRSAMVLCLVPSAAALSSGLIPALLSPMVPFIMIGNVILVLSIDYFYNRLPGDSGYWRGLAAGAILKFLFLYSSFYVISGLLIKEDLAFKVQQMLSWPQLWTAMTGGMIAFAFLKFLKKL